MKLGETENGTLAKLCAFNEKSSKTMPVKGKFQMEQSCFCGLCNFLNSQKLLYFTSMKCCLIILTSLSRCYSDFITLGMPCSHPVAMEKISVINKNI